MEIDLLELLKMIRFLFAVLQELQGVDLEELLKWIKVFFALIAALREFAALAPYYGRIAIDCVTHYCYQSSSGSLMWLSMLLIMYWGQPSFMRSLDSRPRRLVSSIFRFAFLSGLLGAALAHLWQDYL